MRAPLVLLVLAVAASAAPADDYFELGLDYLKKGFFARARRAFSESLVRAPGQPVPTIFAGVAAAAEGRDAAVCARLLRRGVLALPEGHRLALDLRERLPSARALALVKQDYRRELKRAAGRRPDALTVLAFLEVFDGDAMTAPALAALPKGAYREKLAAIRPGGAAASSRSTTPPTSSAPSGARDGSSSGRS